MLDFLVRGVYPAQIWVFRDSDSSFGDPNFDFFCEFLKNNISHVVWKSYPDFYVEMVVLELGWIDFEWGTRLETFRPERKRSWPFQNCSPVLGTNHLEFDWFVPKNGTSVLKGVF